LAGALSEQWSVERYTHMHINGACYQLCFHPLFPYAVVSQLITLHDSTAYNSLEIVWNTEPLGVVYLHPYMVAFTEHTLEVRMASNGSLMQTVSVPDLKLISAKVRGMGGWGMGGRRDGERG
jgi:hypothetical protein